MEKEEEGKKKYWGTVESSLKEEEKNVLPHLFLHDKQEAHMSKHAVQSRIFRDKNSTTRVAYCRPLVTLSLYFNVISLNP